jgi:hypothetical protein
MWLMSVSETVRRPGRSDHAGTWGEVVKSIVEHYHNQYTSINAVITKRE